MDGYIVAGVAAMVVIFGLYFAYAQHEMHVDAATIASQKIAIASSALVITQMEKDTADIKSANSKLSAIVDADIGQRRNLETILGKIQTFPTNQSGKLQGMINQGSINRSRCIALATGATPTKNEVNKLCPQLLPAVVKVKK